MARRLVALELEVPRIYGHIRTGEALQDRQNSAVAARLIALEKRFYGA